MTEDEYMMRVKGTGLIELARELDIPLLLREEDAGKVVLVRIELSGLYGHTGVYEPLDTLR